MAHASVSHVGSSHLYSSSTISNILGLDRSMVYIGCYGNNNISRCVKSVYIHLCDLGQRKVI